KDHPDYLKKLAAAKHANKTAVELPYIAKAKWANPKFQERMMEQGFKYDPSLWKGWLPYEAAKQIQAEWFGAKSRSEYEFYVKLFGLRFLPARPDAVYEEWEGWASWLTTTNTFSFNIIKTDQHLPFLEALTIAKSFKKKSLKDWSEA